MKPKIIFLGLIGLLLFAAGIDSPPAFADIAAPAIAGQTDSAADNSDCPGRMSASGNTNVISVLEAAMRGQRMNMEVIANNLANLETIGFKASQLRFQDLTRDGEGQTIFFNGSEPVMIKRLFTQGKLMRTGNNLDLGIRGAGFFMVQMPDGTLAYTRDGNFGADAQGRVITCNGYPVQGGFQPAPAGTTSISIARDGHAVYTTSSGLTTFQVQLARFINPGNLNSITANLFQETTASGQAEMNHPGVNGFGVIEQGYVELSNVSLSQEKANLNRVCRSYKMTLQALQSFGRNLSQADHSNDDGLRVTPSAEKAIQSSEPRR